MRRVTDDFLLNMAEVSATLIGLFLVGVFFYMEGALHRRSTPVAMTQPYLRAGTRITLIVFAIPLGLSLAIVSLELVWARVLFVVLATALLAANVDSIRRVRGVRSVALLMNEAFATGLTLLLVILPWALGGFRPTREDLTWSILLAFAAGVLSVSATVMSAFEPPPSTTPTEHAGDLDELAGGSASPED